VKRKTRKRLPTKYRRRARLPLAERRNILNAAINVAWTGARVGERVALAEHLTDIGLDEIAEVLGVDAIVTYLDEPTTQLLNAISRHAQNTETPIEDIVTNLMTQLEPHRPEALN
jgi:hypothetical protein